MAAGIGVAHEYFNPRYAAIAAARWELPPLALSADQIASYIGELRRRRAAGGVFATKLQYWQYRAALRNEHGRALFRDAVVVHLFRADVFRQFLSVLKAVETGRYDFSDRATLPPQHAARIFNERYLLEAADDLMAEDAGFRRLFIFSGIRPIFVEFDELNRDPRSIVEKIANVLSAPVDREGLDKALALAGPYGKQQENDARREERVLEMMRKFAFEDAAGTDSSRP
jgi:LPS sulfotransferase NodH